MPRRFHSGATQLSAFLLALAAASPAGAQAAGQAAQRPAGAPFDLSVANIMRGELLTGRSPNELRWSADGRWLYFRWRQPESRDTTTSIYRVAPGRGTPERLADSVADRTAPAVSGDWDAARRRRAFVRGGDVYVAEVGGRERRVTDTPVNERSAQLSGDGRTVFFVSGSNLFATPVEGGPIRQLTDLRAEAEPAKKDTVGQRGELEREQARLLEVIRDRIKEREHREALDSARTRVRPVYIGRNATVGSVDVSPTGRYVLVGVNDRAEEKQTLVPNFVTESGYTEPLNVRSKVGDVQAGQRMALVDLATGRATWLQAEDKARRVTLATAAWAPREDRALLIGIPADFKERWLYTVGADARLTTVDRLRDTAWVGGPGLFTAGWLPDGRVYFVSERTGWAHLYTAPAAGGEATPVTSGEWEVTDVQLSPDGRTFWLTTSETHRGERNLYAVSVNGGRRTRVTSLDGWNESVVSPDGRWVAVLHSVADRPADLFLMPNRAGARAERVTQSTTAEFRSGPWIRPEVVTFPARDGQQVYARIYRPRDLGAQPNGAAVLFVHGAGYLQNAHRGWSAPYFREYMFNHLLASRGYTVLDIDYRGSAGYGAAVRTGIYRHMGGKDLSDHVDGVRWLVANEGVDPGRVGLYGGSYGGFITLMGLFTEPDVFRSGAALRSVTDWAHYNHPYTARILNQPQDDPEAYRRSSPIYFAEGLRGDLLIAHGMVDTNVHFQDVVRLAQRLIELGKTNWEMAVYPVEDHSFVRPDSWTDEYRRVLELFERTLPPGAPAR
ncbi:MAG: prolyl oligopeptidase family serine peptidase [Gemmatimonadota bacterium]